MAVLLGRTRLFLRDWIPFVAIFLAYELMRGIADDAGFPVHVTDVIAAERLIAFGQLPTQVLQDWLAPAQGVGPAAIVATFLYMLHFALPIVTGLLLWVSAAPAVLRLRGGLHRAQFCRLHHVPPASRSRRRGGPQKAVSERSSR